MAETTTGPTGNRIGVFIQEVREELGKVVWPGRDESFRLTIVVLFVMVLSMVVIFGIDAFSSKILELILSLGK